MEAQQPQVTVASIFLFLKHSSVVAKREAERKRGRRGIRFAPGSHFLVTMNAKLEREGEGGREREKGSGRLKTIGKR